MLSVNPCDAVQIDYQGQDRLGSGVSFRVDGHMGGAVRLPPASPYPDYPPGSGRADVLLSKKVLPRRYRLFSFTVWQALPRTEAPWPYLNFNYRDPV
jgi:hypothetical protein